MSQSIIPTQERVLIGIVSAPPPSEIIHTMKSQEEKSLTGEILAVGPNVSFKVGQRVIVGAFTGIRLKANNQEMMMCRADEIHGIIIDPNLQVFADVQ